MKISETDRIKNALVNVSTLATHSDYYNKDRDDQDIELIEEIVKKEIPKKPEIESEYFVGEDNVKITVTVFFCKNCGCRIGHRDNYCINCGQRLDWEEQQ